MVGDGGALRPKPAARAVMAVAGVACWLRGAAARVASRSKGLRHGLHNFAYPRRRKSRWLHRRAGRTSVEAIGVSTREAGWLLGMSEPQVRRLLRRGRLRLSAPGRVDPQSVRDLFVDDALLELRTAALAYVLAGRVAVPVPLTRYARPAPISDFPRFIVPIVSERAVRSHAKNVRSTRENTSNHIIALVL